MKLERTEQGNQFISGVSDVDLMRITDNSRPICDSCVCSLIGHKDIVIIPILNHAVCKRCSAAELGILTFYPEEEHIENMRVDYYLRALGRR